MLTGAIIGVVVALVLTVVNRSKAKSGTGLPGQIERDLRGKAPMNLKDVSVLVGLDSFMGRGKVAQALNALHSTGKVKINQAPPGTKQLDKVNVITYEIVG